MKKRFVSLLAAVGMALFGLSANAQSPTQGTDFLINPPASGSAVSHTMTAVGTNSKLIKGSATQMFGIAVANASGATVYVKLYNKATAPTCGTDTPVRTLLVATATNYESVRSDYGIQFPLGLGICVTGAIGDADTTATAVGAAIDVVYR